MSPTHISSYVHVSRAQRILYWIVCALLVFTTACNTPVTPTLQSTPVPQPTPKPRETLPPALVEMSPPPSSEIGPSQPLVLYFNQAMERASVEGALKLNPPVAGRFDWVDDSTVSFTPDQPLPAGQDVLVSLNTNARAANGLSLQKALDVPYHTSGGLMAVNFVPSPDAYDVDPSSAVIVAFNRPVVPLGGDPTTLPAAFTISPAVQGRGEWLNTSTYIFHPEPAMAGGTAYAVTLTADLTTTDGLGWAEGFDPNLPWMFTTVAPQVVSFEPITEMALGLDEPIVIGFNQPMDTASVESHFSVFNEAGTVSGALEWNDKHTQMTFKAGNLYQRNAQYWIHLDADAASAGGSPLGMPYEVLMVTYPSFTLMSSDPANNGMVELGYGSGRVKLSFQSPVKRQDFKSLITVEPAVDDLNIYTDWDSDLNLNIYGNFKPRTTYTLRVSPDLQDKWGQTLPEPVVLQFQTSGIQPSFRFAYPVYYSGRATFLNPANPSMAVYAANVDTARVTRGRISLTDMFEYYQMDGQSMADFPPAVVTTWTQALNLPQDVSQMVDISLNQGQPLDPGVYYFSIFSDITTENWNSGAFLGVVSHVNLMLKGMGNKVLVWVVDLDTNQPIANTQAVAYNAYGMQVGSAITDSQGLAEITLSTDAIFTGTDSQYFVMVGSGTDDPNFGMAFSDWKQGLNAWDFGLSYDYSKNDPVVYLYTDRPIYRPGQTVYYRGVVRARDNGRYFPSDLGEVELQVNAPYSIETGEQPTSQPQTLTVSEYGTFSGSYALPADATPGTYNFSFLTSGLGYPNLYFKVAEYRKPEIEMTVTFANGAEALAGSDIQATIESKYYFGAPAGNMKVNWSLYANPGYFYLPGGFDIGPANTRWMLPPWYYYNGGGLGTYLAGGDVETDQNGKITINVPYAEIQDQLGTGKTQYLTLEANLTQEGEFPISGRAEQTLHPERYYIAVNGEQWMGQAGHELGFTIQTVDWKQKDVGNVALHAVFSQVEWKETTYDTSTGSYSYEEVRTEVGSTDFVTDGQGQARIAFTPADAGVYEVRVTGGSALTESLTWVSGPGYAPWPAQANNSLHLTADADQYDPGQTANIFIPNPFGPGAVGLVSIERGKVMRTEVIHFSDAGYQYALPLTDEDAPNVYFSVIVIGKTESGVPDFRAGYVNVKVTPSAFTLNVSLTPTPQKGEPGGLLRFDVLVTDRQGNPVQGEFSLAVVDKAIFALADPNSEPITQAFYGIQPLGISTSLTLAASTERAVAQQLGRGGGGGDGAVTPPLREKFEDTAFWNATITTDAQGRANVEFPLPDNLTTWVATIRGLTDATLVGEAESEMVVSKDLLVRPVTPRFLVMGDRVQLAANVNNTTDADLADVAVTLQASGVELEGAALQTVNIPAHGRVNLTWWANVQDVTEVELIFSAKAGNLEDITRPVWGKLPVLHYSSPQTFGTSGMLAEAGEQLEIVSLPRTFTASGGELSVELSPSLAASILDGLTVMEKYPYDMTEAVVSRLFANTAVYHTLQRLNLSRPELQTKLEEQIVDAIAWLENAQNGDGGWGWLPSNGSSEDYISLYTMLALKRAQQAGFTVSEGQIELAWQYAAGFVTTVTVDDSEDILNREVFRAYVASEIGYSLDLQNLYALRTRLAPYARAMLALAYKTQYPEQTTEYRTLISDLEGSAVRSATGAHWNSATPGYYNLDSANFNSAVVILALARFDPANPLMTDAMRYLVSSRRATGGWYSSYDSAWVLYSLTEAMAATGELQASYAFHASLNGEIMAEGQANGPDALTTVKASAGLNALYPADPNALRIDRGEGSGRLYYRAFLTVDKPVEEQAAVNKGMTVSRVYYLGGQDCANTECTPIQNVSLAANKNVVVRVSVTIPDDRHYVVVEDYFPAGTEVLDVSLNTTQQGGEKGSPEPVYSWADFFDRGFGWWYFSSPKIYDDHVRWVSGYLPAGTYELTYTLTPIQAGEFRILPAHAYEYYFPDVEGSSTGTIFTVGE